MTDIAQAQIVYMHTHLSFTHMHSATRLHIYALLVAAVPVTQCYSRQFG